MKIALIDDQQSILNIYRTMLVKSGALEDHELMTFDNIQSFLDSYKLFNKPPSQDEVENYERIGSSTYTCPYDAVICDYNLGKDSINGYCFLFHLKENGHEGLAVLLTADNSDEMQIRMNHAPFLEYVFKGGREAAKNPYVVLKELLNNLRIKLSKGEKR